MLRPDSQPDPFRSRPPVLKPVNPTYNHITQLARFKTVYVSMLQGAHLHARLTEPT